MSLNECWSGQSDPLGVLGLHVKFPSLSAVAWCASNRVSPKCLAVWNSLPGTVTDQTDGRAFCLCNFESGCLTVGQVGLRFAIFHLSLSGAETAVCTTPLVASQTLALSDAGPRRSSRG